MLYLHALSHGPLCYNPMRQLLRGLGLPRAINPLTEIVHVSLGESFLGSISELWSDFFVCWKGLQNTRDDQGQL